MPSPGFILALKTIAAASVAFGTSLIATAESLPPLPSAAAGIVVGLASLIISPIIARIFAEREAIRKRKEFLEDKAIAARIATLEAENAKLKIHSDENTERIDVADRERVELRSLVEAGFVASSTSGIIPVYRPRILLVEDDRTTSAAISRLLTREGATVTPAFTLTDALRCVEESGYEFVILDLKLPDGEGEAIVEAVRRKAGSPAKVIVVSATVDTDRVGRINPDAYFPKPLKRWGDFLDLILPGRNGQAKGGTS